MRHNLKIDSEFFDAVSSGLKPWELRKDDRDFSEGDILVLEETDNGDFTGRKHTVEVTFILRNAERYGLRPGYVCMSVKPINSN